METSIPLETLAPKVRECTICYENRETFKSCKTCTHEICCYCDEQLVDRRCPYCRSDYEEDEAWIANCICLAFLCYLIEIDQMMHGIHPQDEDTIFDWNNW